jgi:Fuc2NAc and GlcNAc transferase
LRDVYIIGLSLAAGTTLFSWALLGILLKYYRGFFPLDHPNKRSMHEQPIPRGGGIVIAGLFILGSIFFIPTWPGIDRFLLALVVGTLVICTLGWLDDQKSLNNLTKLTVQLIIGVICVALMQPETKIYLFTGTMVNLASIILIPSLILWITWIINVFNFMDGVDGLVASQAIINAFVLSIWFFCSGDNNIALVCLILGGATSGVIFFNWAPAKIFLGDSGSLSLGFIFGVLAIYGVTKYKMPVSGFIVLYGVFLADTGITLLRRILKRERWWEPHNQHFYQRIVRNGVSHSKMSIIVVIANSGLAVLATLQVVS